MSKYSRFDRVDVTPIQEVIFEGESGGDADIVYGESKQLFTPGFRVTERTINEILVEQRRVSGLMSKANAEAKRYGVKRPYKFVSSAVGKYQFIRRTLEEQVRRMGVDLNVQKLTSEFQDRIFKEDSLGAKRPQVREYLNTENPTKAQEDAAILAMAREWASMPGLDGKSVYGGQRTPHTVEDVRIALKASHKSAEA